MKVGVWRREDNERQRDRMKEYKRKRACQESGGGDGGGGGGGTLACSSPVVWCHWILLTMFSYKGAGVDACVVACQPTCRIRGPASPNHWANGTFSAEALSKNNNHIQIGPAVVITTDLPLLLLALISYKCGTGCKLGQTHLFWERAHYSNE